MTALIRRYMGTILVNLVIPFQSTQVESVHTELPFSYRKLPYCLPSKEINYAENLGLLNITSC